MAKAKGKNPKDFLNAGKPQKKTDNSGKDKTSELTVGGPKKTSKKKK